jgi:hypothetical protein
MMSDTLTPAMLRRLATAAVRRADRATLARIDAVAEQVAAVLPDAAISSGADGVRMAAPGLRSRLFGSRRRGPDLALAALLQRAGGGR